MKKILCVLILLFLQISYIHADSYCVLSEGDNTVVDSKNMNEPQSVASISKIMTAIIAIEIGKLDDTWKCGKELKQAYGSMLYLKEGENVSLRSMLYGLMLRSGNDAAIEIATHIAKDEASFVKLMNEKAKDIGMLNTVFRNASGLDEKDGGNVSTAYDMALLMSYAMKNKTFRTITGSEYYTSESNMRWKNKNRLLFDYPFTTGGKTGFTKKAGRTLVTTARYDTTESVVVTLQTSNDFEFHKSKHQELFQSYKSVTLIKKGEYSIDGKLYTIPNTIQTTLKKDGSEKVDVYAHIEKKRLIIEVSKNKHVDVYTFDMKKKSVHL